LLAGRWAQAFVVAWSLLRVAVASLEGLDFEGFVALVVVVATLRALSSRSTFS
jgi:hypothetical protein